MDLNASLSRKAFAVHGAGDDRDSMTCLGEGMRHFVGVSANSSPSSLRRILLRDVADVQSSQPDVIVEPDRISRVFSVVSDSLNNNVQVF